jgi:hypothetical protein
MVDWKKGELSLLHEYHRKDVLTADECTLFLNLLLDKMGARGSVVIKALCYKLEGHGFETQ